MGIAADEINKILSLKSMLLDIYDDIKLYTYTAWHYDRKEQMGTW